MFTSRRLVTLAARYPAAAVMISFTLAAGVPGMTGPSPSPSTTNGGAAWAVTVSGQKVPVTKPVFTPTPVHPEKITHPRACLLYTSPSPRD